MRQQNLKYQNNKEKRFLIINLEKLILFLTRLKKKTIKNNRYEYIFFYCIIINQFHNICFKGYRKSRKKSSINQNIKMPGFQHNYFILLQLEKREIISKVI